MIRALRWSLARWPVNRRTRRYDRAGADHLAVYRRRGYTALPFEALEAEVAMRGLSGIALHVFGHNTATRVLYASLDYRRTKHRTVHEGFGPEDA